MFLLGALQFATHALRILGLGSFEIVEMRTSKLSQASPRAPTSKEDRWTVAAISLCLVLALISFGMAALA